MSDTQPLLSRFPWLSSFPRFTKTLAWPPDIAPQVKRTSSNDWSRRTSVLDDRVAFLAHPKEGDGTWVFYADVKAGDHVDGAANIVCERIAVLDTQMDMIALLPRSSSEGEGGGPEFATLKAETSSIILRIHSKTGTVIHEGRVEAAGVYRHLVVGPASNPRLAVCTTSGRPEPSGCGGYPFYGHLLDYHSRYPDASQIPAFGDTIVVWDWQQDEMTSVDLTPHARPHQASFDLLPSGHIALAAAPIVSAEYLTPELQILTTDPSPTLVNTFMEGFLFDHDAVETTLAQRGTSASSGMTVHYHDNQGLTSALPHQLLVSTDLEPRTDGGPEGLVETWKHPAYVRTLKCKVASRPVQAGNRVLVHNDPLSEEDEEEEEDQEEEDQDQEAAGPDALAYHILDFDPEHVEALLALSDAERTALSHELSAAAESAGSIRPRHKPLVEVITRHFAFDAEGNEDDLEYGLGSAPAGWTAHLAERERARPAGLVGLAFDERPADRREAVAGGGSACVRIRLSLSAPAWGRSPFALTESGVLKIPDVDGEGYMYYYPW